MSTLTHRLTSLAAGLIVLAGSMLAAFWIGLFVGLVVRGVRVGAGW